MGCSIAEDEKQVCLEKVVINHSDNHDGQNDILFYLLACFFVSFLTLSFFLSFMSIFASLTPLAF